MTNETLDQLFLTDYDKYLWTLLASRSLVGTVGAYFDIVCIDGLVRPSYSQEDLKHCIGRAKINVSPSGNVTIDYTPKQLAS